MRHGWLIVGIAVLLLIPVSYSVASPQSVLTIGENTITVTFITSNPVTVNTSGYSADTTTVTIDGADYDGIALSNDSNSSGGIANNRGDVNVSVDLDGSRPFCFAIYGGGEGRSRLDFDLTINGVTTSYPASLTGNNGWLYVGTDGIHTSIGDLDTSDAWFSSATVISADIVSTGRVRQNVTLTVVFDS